MTRPRTFNVFNRYAERLHFYFEKQRRDFPPNLNDLSLFVEPSLSVMDARVVNIRESLFTYYYGFT